MKFRKALRIPFRVELLDRNREEDVERVYGIIAANRAHKGYPLRMSLDDVKRTAEVARAEFIAMSLEGRDVAAALVYRVAPGIMQVVYWGDAPGWEELYPMHRFAPEVFHICRGLGAGILDIGPSSEDGIPSEGLCFFKESIGCLPSSNLGSRWADAGAHGGGVSQRDTSRSLKKRERLAMKMSGASSCPRRAMRSESCMSPIT